MRLLAFDPGGTTGWVYLRGGELIQHGNFSGWEGVHEVLRRWNVDIIVIENYRMRPTTPKWSVPQAAEVIGVLEYQAQVAQGYDPDQIVRQEPHMAMHLIGPKGLSAHEKSALGHAAAYLLKRGTAEEKRVVLQYIQKER